MQPVWCIFPFRLTSGIDSGMEQSIIQLPVISNCSHHRFSVGLNIIGLIYIFRMRIYNPVKAIKSVWSAVTALFILIFCNKNSVIGTKRIIADPLNHLK